MLAQTQARQQPYQHLLLLQWQQQLMMLQQPLLFLLLEPLRHPQACQRGRHLVRSAQQALGSLVSLASLAR